MTETTRAIDRPSSGNGFSSGLLFGGLLGAVTALLLAPQSGERTRSMLRDGTLDVKDRIRRTAHDTRQRAEGVVDETLSMAQDLTNRGAQAIQEQKDRVQRTAQAAAKAARETWSIGSES